MTRSSISRGKGERKGKKMATAHKPGSRTVEKLPEAGMQRLWIERGKKGGERKRKGRQNG